MTAPTTGTRSLPILDLSRFRDRGAGRERFLADLRHAAHEVGFFYVTGHGVPAAVTDGITTAAREFFALPEADRLEIENIHSPQFRGYTRVGAERTAGAADWREQIDIGPERAALPVGPGDPDWKRLVGPNQWPSALPGLKDVVLAWQDEVLRVSREVLRALAAALGQDESYFDAWFDEESSLQVKIVRYPGPRTPAADQDPADQGPVDQGVGVHKDYGYLTLLQQDDVGGLQVQAADGGWIDATTVPGSFVVNIGEMLEIATRGYLTATRHRVVSPPAGVDRFSFPFFLGPRLDAVVQPLTLPPALAAEATGVSDDPDNPLHAAFGENAVVGWLRSHPRVAQRWWADVLARHA
jgi:isopenicillin N synthase-like dioxygenase